MRRGRFIASVAVVVASFALSSCDQGDVAEPIFRQVRVAPARDFTSGARLKARFYVVDGLVEVFTTFHDAMLDVDCAFEDENGAHVGPGNASYCLPPGMARHREGKGPYLDDACTVRAAFAPPGVLGGAMYALDEPVNACMTAPAVYRTKPAVRREAFVKDDTGECLSAGPMEMQPLAAVVPLETFVRAVEKSEDRPGRIGVRVLLGDDGSRRVVGGFDRVRNEPVRVGIGDDGARRWLPARIAFAGNGDDVYADAACSKRLASKIARTATCPLGAAVVLEGTCGIGHYFELGPALASVFARDAQNVCSPDRASDVLAFALGAPIAPSVYEPVVTMDIGTPRARRRGVGAWGDTVIAWDEVIDSMTGEACNVVATADGTLRCLPALAVPVAFFADEACTERAVARTITGCDQGADPHFVRDALEQPSLPFEVVRVVDAIYTQETTGCERFPPPVPSRFFAVKDVDVARFPTAMEGRD